MKIYALDRRSAVTDYTDLKIVKDAPCGEEFAFTCSRHEYFVIQLVVEPLYSRRDVSVQTGNLVPLSEGKEIERAVTCFNTSGILPNGEKYTKKLNLIKGILQPLYFGINFVKADKGTYYTEVAIADKTVKLTFELNDELVFNMGTSDSGRLSRLKWLDSSAYRDKRPIKYFEEVVTEKNVVRLTGKRVTFGNDGFIEQAESYFDGSNHITSEPVKRLFARPMEFVCEGQKFKYNKLRTQMRSGTAVMIADGKSEKFRIDVSAAVLYEGAIHYDITLSADKNAVVNDASLYMYFESARYVAGLGEEGGFYKDISFCWENKTASDSLFVGDVNCGARIKFTDGKPHPVAPMNLYSPARRVKPENTWANFTKGGVDLYRDEEAGMTVMRAYTGQLVFKAGDSMTFSFIVHLTPFKPLDLALSLASRVAESDIEPSYAALISRAEKDASGYVSISAHGESNPYRNYPFDKFREIESLSLEAHKRKLGLTVAFDTGSLSVHARETFALKSLGDEIIFRRAGKAKENALTSVLGGGVVICEDALTASGERDLAYLTVPGSRMDNFFVEGVKFLTTRTAADGVSLMNTPIVRDTAERAAKCIERTAGRRAMMELGFSSRYNKENGYLSALTAYADILPFMTKLYAASGFSEKMTPDAELVEMSGLIYGLSADSPEHWGIMRSLAFATLPRYGKDEQVSLALGDIQRVFADFSIGKARLRGFWDAENPLRVDTSSVLATSFIKGESMLAVLYNASDKAVRFEVGVENKLGFTTVGKKLRAPAIEGLQRARRINIGKPMRLKAHSGLMFVVK